MSRHLVVLTLVTLVTMLLESTQQKGKTSKMNAAAAGAFIMAVYLGLRTWWLADNIKYHTQFMNVGYMTLGEMLEDNFFNIGLRYYFHLVYTYIGQNFQIALIGIAIFEIVSLAYVVYKYSESVYQSYFVYIFLGFYYFLFSGLKQGIAMGFLMLAFTGIIEDNPFKFLILTLLGSLFHAPAFVFIISYPWSKMKFGHNYLLFLTLILVLVLVFRGQIVNTLSEMYYDESELVASSGIGGKFIAMMMILLLSMLVRPPVPNDPVYYKTFNLMVLAALIQSFSVFGNNFTRLADYYFQFSVIFIPFILSYREAGNIPADSMPLLRFTKQSYMIVVIVFLLLGFAYYRNYTKDDIHGISNAPFFWEVSQTPWGS